jgi:Tol biopolymer transport system component
MIKFMRKENNRWTAPQLAAFLGQHDNMYPTFSYDDKKLFYSSDRPTRAGEEVKERGIWFVETKEQGWSEPQYIGFDSLDVYALSVAKNGNLYFMAQRSDNQGLYDLYCSRFVNGEYAPPEKLAAPINTPYYEDCPYVAPDESYMIFESSRPGGFGGLDLSFSNQSVDGSWSEPRNLSAAINTSFSERFAQISRDGKYFFFGSNRNGNFDIYWVDVRVIDELRSKD